MKSGIKSYVIDTESRSLSQKEAYRNVELKIKYAFKYVYKIVKNTIDGFSGS